MTWYQRLLREPTLVTAVLVAGLAFATAFGLHLTDAQTGAILGLVAAVIALLRFVTTPASEVIAQQKPGEPVKATAKAEAAWGIPKDDVVAVQPADLDQAA